MLKLTAQTDPKFDLRSVCDLWSHEPREGRRRRREAVRRAAEDVSSTPRRLLADRDLDAVMIATGDHQHARILAEVVRAGKDCYCEKPMANTLEDAKLARDTVVASKQVVQMGSQWLSCPYQQRVREMIREGKLGKIVSISQSWNFNGPRWHVPKSANIAAIREAGYGLEPLAAGPRPPSLRSASSISNSASSRISPAASPTSGTATAPGWRIFTWTRSSRTTPSRTAASSPGTTCARIRTRSSASPPSPKRRCSTPTAPRSATRYGDHTIIRGTHGTLYSPGGEGSPQWWYLPETRSGWGSNVVFDLARGQGNSRNP